MIQEIRINGFKSMTNFSLKIKPGLNILVGPNGSGKTNIISFFEFLSYVNGLEIHNAVSKMGGAGTIFSKIGESIYDNSLNAHVFGRVKVNKKYIYYNYYFELSVASNAGLIYYKNQRLKLHLSPKKFAFNERVSQKLNFDFDIENSCSENHKPTLTIHKMDRRKIKPRFSYIKDKEEFVDRISMHINRFENRCIVQSISREIREVSYVHTDLEGGEVFNIIPSKVKQPEDIAKQPGIQKDGTGLASTLFAIKNGRYRPVLSRAMPYRRTTLDKQVYTRIVNLVKLANDSISDLSVDNNPFDNQLIIKVEIESNNTNKTVLPLSAMSDGTIKWITLITAVLSSAKIFSIEEPENFLHPWMQSEIVKIMRNSFQSRRREEFALMSTHSETLLNNVDPDEVIVVKMDNGQTKAKRVANIKILRQEIEATGFGLGFYYLTGTFNS